MPMSVKKSRRKFGIVPKILEYPDPVAVIDDGYGKYKLSHEIQLPKITTTGMMRAEVNPTDAMAQVLLENSKIADHSFLYGTKEEFMDHIMKPINNPESITDEDITRVTAVATQIERAFCDFVNNVTDRLNKMTTKQLMDVWKILNNHQLEQLDRHFSFQSLLTPPKNVYQPDIANSKMEKHLSEAIIVNDRTKKISAYNIVMALTDEQKEANRHSIVTQINSELFDRVMNVCVAQNPAERALIEPRFSMYEEMFGETCRILDICCQEPSLKEGGVSSLSNI